MSSLKAWLSLAAALELAAALPVLLLGSCFEGMLGRNTCAKPQYSSLGALQPPCQKVRLLISLQCSLLTAMVRPWNVVS